MAFRRKSRGEAGSSEVERAMERVAAEDNADTRSALYNALLNTTLVAETASAPAEEGSRTPDEGETITFVMVASDEGDVLPVFTSVDRLLEFRPQGTGYVALPSRALFEMAVASGTASLVVNPASATGGEIFRHELKALAQGRLPLGETEVVPEGTDLRIGQPAQPPPDDVVVAVRRAVAAEERAVEAWLFLIQEGANASELAIGIVLAEGLEDDAGNEAMRAIADGAGADDLVFMRVDGGLRSTLANGAGDLIFER